MLCSGCAVLKDVEEDYGADDVDGGSKFVCNR